MKNKPRSLNKELVFCTDLLSHKQVWQNALWPKQHLTNQHDFLSLKLIIQDIKYLFLTENF